MDCDTAIEEFETKYKWLRVRERTLLSHLESLKDDAESLEIDLDDFDTTEMDREAVAKLSDLHVQAAELFDRVRDAAYGLEA